MNLITNDSLDLGFGNYSIKASGENARIISIGIFIFLVAAGFAYLAKQSNTN
ncbi:hypothetical protein GCM10011514_00970 [Emticicia aquatilis]|uniref:Uncharacterized protein n=1 Tax=Emticicia aquatilis TaxID=1537369 RepID=A0A916YD95_9BACT|nr:hypothetical protein [Emticicia aquatilis]GGD40691.1 hypothetical protein GCM10011514_00970 [Emticicia aquatilis]